MTEQLVELRRYATWLEHELERQRQMNSSLRAATADMARTFQASLGAIVRAGEAGDMQQVREVAHSVHDVWRAYLSQIIATSQAQSGTQPTP